MYIFIVKFFYWQTINYAINQLHLEKSFNVTQIDNIQADLNTYKDM